MQAPNLPCYVLCRHLIFGSQAFAQSHMLANVILQEHDRIALEQAAAKKVAAEAAAAAEATWQLATTAMDILSCPWPLQAATDELEPSKLKPK